MTTVIGSGVMKISDSIIAKEIQGETVLLNKENGDYFSLNKMGTEIYNYISGGKEIEKIADCLFKKYDTEYGIIKKDIEDLIITLKKKSILIE